MCENCGCGEQQLGPGVEVTLPSKPKATRGPHRQLPKVKADVIRLVERRAKLNGVTTKAYTTRVLEQGLFLEDDGLLEWVMGMRDPQKHVDAAASLQGLLLAYRKVVNSRNHVGSV